MSGIGGGKAAAAADLARARGAREEKDVDREKLANAAAVFQASDALQSALRTYSRGHPALGRFTEKLEGALLRYFDRDDELSFGLEPRALLVDGLAAQTADRVESNIWFPLFAAGIRELTLLPGIDAEEVLALFELLLELRDAASLDQEGEDDAVTMLWQAELEHVEFIAIDSFTHGEGDEEKLAALRQMVETSMLKELTALSLAGEPYAANELPRRLRDVALTSADVDVLRAENLAALDDMPMPGAPSPALHAIDPGELGAFAAACVEEPTIVERYVDALLAALGRADDGEPILEQMRDLFAAVIKDRRYIRGRRMVEQIIAAASRGRGDWRDDIERRVITPATLELIVDAIASGDRDAVVELTKLVRALSSWAAAPLVGRLPSVDDDQLRATLAEIAAGWGEATQLALRDTIERTADERRALELVRLAVRVGGRAVIRTLRAALEHWSSMIRANAFRALAQRASPAEADAAAIAALADADPVVRRLALEHIIRYRPAAAARAVARRVESDLGEIDLEELCRLYTARAAVGGPAVAGWLLDRLGQRGLLGRARANDERIAAAGALAYLRWGEARLMLSKLAGSRLSRKDVRDAAAAALADLDKPPPAAPPPRETDPDPVPRSAEAPSRARRESAGPRISFRQTRSPQAPPPEPKPRSESMERLLSEYLEADEIDKAKQPKPSESLELLLSDYVKSDD